MFDLQFYSVITIQAGDDAKVIGIDVVTPLVEWGTRNINKHDPQLFESGKLTIKGTPLRSINLFKHIQ